MPDVRQRGFAAAIIAFFSATLVAGCSSLDEVIESAPKPSARILGAGVRNLSLQSLDLVFDVEVSNPYNVSLPLVDLTYTLGSGGKQLLSGSIKPSGSVPANGKSVLQLPARLDLASVVKTLPGVKPGAVVPYEAQLNLIVDVPVVGEMTLPVERNGEIPVPALPQITLLSFDVGDLGLDEVRAEARLRVKNTNRFRIELTRVRFDLALGGRKVASTRLSASPKLAPGQTAVVKIPLSLSPRALGAGVLDVLSGSDAGYAISGRLDVMTRYGELALPFSQKGNTTVRRR
ncbi:MAG: LEA type 2 family protein [Betaproteobacteria bacterium]|nr:MAG: LEA type 2 family protein [Betaproteobacteria bacterium]